MDQAGVASNPCSEAAESLVKTVLSHVHTVPPMSVFMCVSMSPSRVHHAHMPLM